jgi:phosphoglycerate dehydrogenase-like enzyme
MARWSKPGRLRYFFRMSQLRIFADLAMPPDALALLRAGTADHELIFPAKPITSVLAKGDPDPAFTTVDVAFGQPDLQSIAQAEKLQWVHVSSSGITRYDTPEFRASMASRGIAVSNSASVYQEGCALHVLSFILAQARNIPRGLASHAANGSPEWTNLRETCRIPRGETALILGYGAIGKRLAELLAPLQMQVIAYRRKARGDEGVPVITDEALPKALAEADHVINILPESVSTQRFFDVPRIAGMKRGAAFYNIGRGATVDQAALVDALRSGQVGAAWLDVTDPEPLPADHPLRVEANCFITPHIAGGHYEEAKSLVRHFLTNLERFSRGEPLLDRVM